MTDGTDQHDYSGTYYSSGSGYFATMDIFTSAFLSSYNTTLYAPTISGQGEVGYEIPVTYYGTNEPSIELVDWADGHATPPNNVVASKTPSGDSQYFYNSSGAVANVTVEVYVSGSYTYAYLYNYNTSSWDLWDTTGIVSADDGVGHMWFEYNMDPSITCTAIPSSGVVLITNGEIWNGSSFQYMTTSNFGSGVWSTFSSMGCFDPSQSSPYVITNINDYYEWEGTGGGS